MKRNLSLFIFGFILLLSSSFQLQKYVAQSDCGLQVADAYTQEVLGKNVGFYVKFYNASDKTIDAIEYQVIFKNGFNEVKGKKTFNWQAGNLVGPMKPKSYLSDGSANWIDSANKLEIKVIRVHFTDDSTCEVNSSIKTLK